MIRDFKLALEALARVSGFTVEYSCTYCRESIHNPEGHELHEIVTFSSPAPEDDEN